MMSENSYLDNNRWKKTLKRKVYLLWLCWTFEIYIIEQISTINKYSI